MLRPQKKIYVVLSSITLSLSGRTCDFGHALLQPGYSYAFRGMHCQKECSNSRHKRATVYSTMVKDARIKRNYYDDLINRRCDECDTSKPLYSSLVNEALSQCIRVQGFLYGCFADHGYNDNSDRVSLDQKVFGGFFKLRDIYLASRLAEEGKLTLPGGMPGFGNMPDEQYLALLAPTCINIDAQQREIGFNLSLSGAFPIANTEKLYGLVGVYVPVRYQQHRLDVTFTGGKLFGAQSFDPVMMQLDSVLHQFFKDFQSIDDFFERGVLAPKGLSLERRQNKLGFGDVAVYTALDISAYCDHIEALQFGMHVLFPTSSKIGRSVLWEIEHGNGGTYQFEPFFAFQSATDSCLINPQFYFGIRLSRSYDGYVRAPQRKTTSSQVLLPPSFANFDIAAFDECDTKALEFADVASQARIQQKIQLYFRVGNFIYDVICRGWSFGLFYDFFASAKESITVYSAQAKTFKEEPLERLSEQRRHAFTWNVAYQDKDVVELYVGLTHVFGGKNAEQFHKLFASLVRYF